MSYKRLNKGLLKSVLSVQSHSEDDGDMIAHIRTFAKENKLTVKEDKFGNLYITKGKAKSGYPCMVSHVDTVHKKLSDFIVFEHLDSLFAYTSDGCCQVGIGGDDKVGVYACLQSLLDHPIIKVAFFRKEELGCQGSAAADMKFFNDCNFVLQLDRKGSEDFSISGAGVELSSKEFRSSVKHLLRKWKFKQAFTSISDVIKLKQRGLPVCVTNISCGYFFPHSDSEVVLMRHVDRAYCLSYDIISEFGNKRFKHKYIPKVYSYPATTYKHSVQGNFDVPWKNQSMPISLPYRTDNEADREIEYQIFKKYPGVAFPHMYMYVHNKPSWIDERYMYLPNERAVYDIQNNEYVKDEATLREIYHNFVIRDSGKEFVFSWALFDWIDKSQARWLNVGKSWILLKNLKRCIELKPRGENQRKHFQNMDLLTKKYETLPLSNMTG